MTPIRTVLHPTDFSEHSEAALGLGRTLARQHGARLVILHVVPVEALAAPTVREVLSDLTAARDALEEERRQIDGPDLKGPVDVQLRRGNVTDEILEAADEVGCDLIVMGSHGRSGLGRLLMGSVAESILRRARCPVLTVKLAHPEPAPTQFESVRGRR